MQKINKNRKTTVSVKEETVCIVGLVCLGPPEEIIYLYIQWSLHIKY